MTTVAGMRFINAVEFFLPILRILLAWGWQPESPDGNDEAVRRDTELLRADLMQGMFETVAAWRFAVCETGVVRVLGGHLDSMDVRDICLPKKNEHTHRINLTINENI